MSRFSLLLFLVLASTAGFAQNAVKLYQAAEEYFYQEQFVSALEIFKEVEKVDPDFADLEYKMLICSLLVDKNYTNVAALEKYEAVMMPKKKRPIDKFYLYWLGRAYLEKNRFEDAEKTLNRFLGLDFYKSEEIVREIEKWLKFAKHAQAYDDADDYYQIYHLGATINSEKNDVSPVYFEDNHELLFISNRDSDGRNYFVYHTYLKEDRQWSTPTIIDNLGLFTEVGATIEVVSKDGRLFQYDNSKKGGLYYSETEDSKKTWSNPVAFEADVPHKDFSSHFYINEAEDRIIFAKDVGSKKSPNLDLYESKIDPATKAWTEPTPLPSYINTEYHEDSPFLSKDGKTLYFASDGHDSFGGFDIFKCTYIEVAGKWGEPESLKYPINTVDDETQFKFSADEKSGYFTSNRMNTYGEMDIFFFWHAEMIELKGSVVGNDNAPLDGAKLYFRPKDYFDMYYYAETGADGTYHLDIPSDGTFDVEVWAGDEKIYTEAFELHAPGDQQLIYTKDFFLNESGERVVVAEAAKEISEQQTKQIEENSTVSVTKETEVKDLGSKFRGSDKAKMKNMYFSTGATVLSDKSLSSLTELKQLMDKYPAIRVEISGHTDNTGTAASNQTISELRAQSVKDWLVKNGIDASRIETIGYGETQPIASNDDEIEGREYNRRIEVRKL